MTNEEPIGRLQASILRAAGWIASRNNDLDFVQIWLDDCRHVDADHRWAFVLDRIPDAVLIYHQNRSSRRH